MRDPFWQSAKILLNFKRPLAIALGGALVSAACFGAGIGMILPALYLLLNEGKTVADLIRDELIRPGQPQWLTDFAGAMATLVPDRRFHAFLLVMLMIGLMSVVGSTGRFLHELITITVVQRAAMIWRSRMYRRLIHTPMIELLASGSSDYMSRVVFDTRPLARAYRAILGKTVEQLLKGAVAILAAFYLDWVLTAIALVCAPPIGILLRKFGKRIRRAARRVLRQRGRMIGALKEMTGGIRVVKAYNAEGYERRRFQRINRGLFDQEMKIRTVRALASPVIDTLGLLGVIGVASIAAFHVLEHSVEPAQFMTVLVFLAGAASSLKPLANLNNQLNEGRAAAGRLMELLALPAEAAGPDARHDLPALPRHRRCIEFHRVTFRYSGQSRPAVDGLDLHVEHGQTIALVGGNGSGKTTLLSLLPRLLEPESGRVRIDEIDIAGVRLRSLRRQIAVVTQQTVLFEGTIAENISYGRRHEPIHRIIEAAKTAFADEFIKALPHGYNTMLGEHGEGLSGGQRQRLCIARAVMLNPTILILDEATSQVDADSEAKINQALRDIRCGRTVFVVAHRLSTVVDADRIVVMQDGCIIDQGEHAQLLERCVLYQTLTRTQLLAG